MNTLRYARNKDAFGDFQLVADTPIESPELLYDVYSAAGSKRMGYFNDQTTLDDYWESATNTTASLNSTYALDSVYLSGSNAAYNQTLRFQTTGSRQIDFLKDTEYSFRARIIGAPGIKYRSDGTTGTIGEKFPEFSLKNSENSTVNNDDLIGRWSVIFFYPKDGSPGCTIESCSFRDKQEEIEALGAQIIGISSDSVSRHQRFKKKHRLQYTLLSDPQSRLSKKMRLKRKI